jgi:OmpA-OmpF porin, OOP family
MFKKSLLILPLMAIAAPSAAQERTFDDRTYFSPSVLFAAPARGVGFDEGWGLNLAIGKPISPRISWEFALAVYDVSADAPGTMRRTSAGISWLYHFREDPDAFQPYVIAGGGVIRSRFAGVNDSSMQGHLGLGIKFPFTDRVSLRLEGRYQKLENSAPHNDWQVHAGFSIPFFARPTPAARPTPPTPPPMVREPATPVVSPAPRPSPEPSPVPPDFDPVYFALDSATLDGRSRETLDEAITVMREHPGITLELGGFTCTLGTAEYNMGLSERRARAVTDYMVRAGIARDRLVPRGYGEADPIGDNSNEAGRRVNRRVELRILSR